MPKQAGVLVVKILRGAVPWGGVESKEGPRGKWGGRTALPIAELRV